MVNLNGVHTDMLLNNESRKTLLMLVNEEVTAKATLLRLNNNVWTKDAIEKMNMEIVQLHNIANSLINYEENSQKWLKAFFIAGTALPKAIA